ncbi:ABC transporter ATP-binding protein [Actinomarinicola tropica]|uniref:ABC transporter ATP-binding protein n=1 Tax=Actinomarinicola tropica TaxID=2789776 RepID=UPI001E4CB040|nr:ABC transporter ATP-binding protein [Actinomarinicola tropica]
MPPAIRTEQLTRRFPSGVALDALDLEVYPGEVLALLGPNGAGKTTTIRLLNGVLSPDGGTASVLGLDPAVDGHAVRQRTGVLTENAGLDDRLTARENLEAVARVRGMRPPAARRRVDELLDRFGMGDRADVAVQGASTGQRKRLALARALLHDPELLFLDEPTSGLDPAATRDVVELIGSLASEHGRTVVLCTHFLGEAGRLADRMAVLHRGRLRASGRPADLAAEMWQGVPARVELSAPADARVLGLIRRIDGVLLADPTPDGARVDTLHRDVLARVVRTLVEAGIEVYAATPTPYTLEDVYFAIEERLGFETPEESGGDREPAEVVS